MLWVLIVAVKLFGCALTGNGLWLVLGSGSGLKLVLGLGLVLGSVQNTHFDELSQISNE